MDFGGALKAIKEGKRAARLGWNGKGQYIKLARDITFKNHEGMREAAVHEDIGSQAIVFCGTRGSQIGWLASQSDMLAEDWEVAE